MNDQSETERGTSLGQWFGLDRLRLSDGDQAVDITIGSETHWDRSHLRRLRQSGDLPGMVPIIDSDFSADGKPFAVTPVVDDPTLTEIVGDGDLEWIDGAGIAEATARAAHEAHLRGLFHGALSPDDIHVVGDDVAIGGIGLGLGGTPTEDRAAWVAPEVRAGAEPTERSDVYSLGKILEYSLGEALDTVPRSIRRLIMWSSSDTPEARPPSAMEFASILAEGLGEDRRTFGPAFIATSSTSELASQASSLVSNHSPTEQARNTALAAGTGVAAAGAAVAAGQFFGDDDSAVDSVDEDIIEGDAFSVVPDDVDADVETDDLDPGLELDDAVEAGPLADVDEVDAELDVEPAGLLDDGVDEIEGELEADLDDDEDAPVAAATGEIPIGAIAAETGDHVITDEDEEFASPAAAQTVDLDETYLPAKRRNRAGLVIAGILALGLAGIAWGVLRSGDDDQSVDGSSTSAAADGSDDDGSAQAGGADSDADTDNGGTDSDATTDGDGDSGDAQSSGTDAGTDDDADTGDASSDGGGDGDGDGTAQSSGTDTDTDTDEATSTTEATTTTEAPATTTTEAPATTTTEATTTTVAEADEDGDSSGSSDGSDSGTQGEPAERAVDMVEGPVAASQGGIQILHGVPGADVDLYVDGVAVIPGFAPGMIAGPIAMDAGDYEVSLFAASDSAPVNASDRDDEPLLSGTVVVDDDAASVVAHLDENGEIAISPFVEVMDSLEPGRGRVIVRHLMATGEVDASVDGEIIGSVAPGDEVAVVIEAGQALVEIVGDDGNVFVSETVQVGDGELVALSAIGAPGDDTSTLIVQRFTGLGTPPIAVNTGDSGLLGFGGDDGDGIRMAGIVMVLMVMGGAVLAIRRRRSLTV